MVQPEKNIFPAEIRPNLPENCQNSFFELENSQKCSVISQLKCSKLLDEKLLFGLREKNMQIIVKLGKIGLYMKRTMLQEHVDSQVISRAPQKKKEFPTLLNRSSVASPLAVQRLNTNSLNYIRKYLSSDDRYHWWSGSNEFSGFSKSHKNLIGRGGVGW